MEIKRASTANEKANLPAGNVAASCERNSLPAHRNALPAPSCNPRRPGAGVAPAITAENSPPRTPSPRPACRLRPEPRASASGNLDSLQALKIMELAQEV